MVRKELTNGKNWRKETKQGSKVRNSKDGINERKELKKGAKTRKQR
jgi:hypothetical protein